MWPPFAPQVFRQRDARFVRLLNQIRQGDGEAAVAELERQCSRPLPEVRGGSHPGPDPDPGPKIDLTAGAALTAILAVLVSVTNRFSLGSAVEYG